MSEPSQVLRSNLPGFTKDIIIGSTPDISQKFSTMQDPYKRDKVKNYVEHGIHPHQNTLDEITNGSEYGLYLYQGDMLLQPFQEEEIVEGLRHGEQNRTKRQAYKDERYPYNIWRKGVNYVFDANLHPDVQKAFKTGAKWWEQDTCIDFREDNSDCDPKTSAKCKMGGFPHPRDCNKCICPSGYGGALCNKRPKGCGQILTATTNYKTLKAKIGKEGSGDRMEYMKCHYWIKGPVGSVIEVKIAKIDYGMATDGCTYAGIEIKTHEDLRLTGYRFCAEEDVGVTLRSNFHVVPVITHSRAHSSEFHIKYRIGKIKKNL
ncbi:hypothetical protein NECAME_08557 [Necator americanus]|uniref:EGF-like domain-containing protein n=1 Tax=Necator americanus TaxID=51031 RepID=W2TJJ6_NECAM|nr:hypothetical protein NECAME_08557 [Necator americanus]ETN81336.1 hypothetical protein NECAME_08557 [Necator americanus]